MNNHIPYISIRSVMFDIYTSMDDNYWDENRMLEWAVKGFRKLSIPAKFQNKVSIIGVIEHTAKIPHDARYIVQIAYKQTFNNEDLEYFKEIMGLTDDDPGIPAHFFNPDGLAQNAVDAIYSKYINQWKPMKPATGSFMKSVACNYTVPTALSPAFTGGLTNPTYIYTDMANCEHEYTIDSDCNMTTTLKDGLAYVSYMGYPTNVDGDTLIPDDENLKEALRHYCMYRYWEAKSLQHEQASTREREWHLMRYQILGTKASAALNMPDTGQMQILLNINNRMVNSTDDFDNLFTTLGNHQANKYLN